jgi:phasin family protein
MLHCSKQSCIHGPYSYNLFYAALQHSQTATGGTRQLDVHLTQELEMTYTAEQFVANNKANVEALEGFAAQAFSGLEKLVELNLATSKSAMEDTFGQLQAVMGAKDPQELMGLQAGLLQPLAEKSVAYGKQIYAVATDTSAELTKAFEAKATEAKNAFSTAVENMVKSAPAGSETAVAAFKSAVAAGQNIIETAQSTAKKAVEMAEANMATASDNVVDVTAKVSKKR